jgi:hypothetical protein
MPFIMHDFDFDIRERYDVRRFLTISQSSLIQQFQDFESRSILEFFSDK